MGVAHVHFFADEDFEQVDVDVPARCELSKDRDSLGRFHTMLVGTIACSKGFEDVGDAHDARLQCTCFQFGCHRPAASAGIDRCRPLAYHLAYGV